MTSFALTAAAAALFAAQTGSSMMSHPADYQATVAACRLTPMSIPRNPPVCRGGPASRLEVQPVCFCNGSDHLYHEPACHTDGRPAMFAAGHQVSKEEDDRLVSCQDLRRGGG